MKYLLILSIALFGLAACGNKEKSSSKYADEISQLTEYIESLDSVERAFIAIDSSEAVNFGAKYEYYKRVLHKYYTVDSIDVDFARRMTLFKAMKGAKGYGVLRTKYLDEVDYTRTQLNKLIKALENNELEKEKVNEFVALEKKGAEVIISTLNSYTAMLNKQKVMYDTLNPYIEPVVDSLVQLHSLEK